MNTDSPCPCSCCQQPTIKKVDDTPLFEQLLRWREMGYHPKLDSALNDKWVLVFDTEHWASRGRPDEHSYKMGLHFATGPCDTPQDAIRAAMEIIR